MYSILNNRSVSVITMRPKVQFSITKRLWAKTQADKRIDNVSRSEFLVYYEIHKGIYF